MKIATYNINNINRRLPNLLAWLAEGAPRCGLPAGTQDPPTPGSPRPRSRPPATAPCGRASRAGTASPSSPEAPNQYWPAAGLPGEPRDAQARYIEAAIAGVPDRLDLPAQRQSAARSEFEYKLAWFDRLIAHAAELHATGLPVVLAGDYNVVPTDRDIYPSTSWGKNALLHPQSRAAFRRLLDQGWTDALRTRHPDMPLYTFWDYMRDRWSRDAGLRLDHILLSPSLATRRQGGRRGPRGAWAARRQRPRPDLDRAAQTPPIAGTGGAHLEQHQQAEQRFKDRAEHGSHILIICLPTNDMIPSVLHCNKQHRIRDRLQ